MKNHSLSHFRKLFILENVVSWFSKVEAVIQENGSPPNPTKISLDWALEIKEKNFLEINIFIMDGAP